MDAQARKLFGMLGSAYAGERRNAFDRLDKYLEGKGLTLPKLWDGLETELAAATADIAKLQTALAGYRRANAAAKVQNQHLRGMLWAKAKLPHLNRRKKIGLGGVLLAAVIGYCELPEGGIAGLFSASAAGQRAAVTETAGDTLDRVMWGNGDSAPFVFHAGGLPWWGVIRGDSDDAHYTDGQNRRVVVHCLRFYAAPASVKADGAYVAPQPYGWFGRLKWPARAVECKNAGPVKEASQ